MPAVGRLWPSDDDDDYDDDDDGETQYVIGSSAVSLGHNGIGGDGRRARIPTTATTTYTYLTPLQWITGLCAHIFVEMNFEGHVGGGWGAS